MTTSSSAYSRKALWAAVKELPVGLSATLLAFFLLVKIYAVSNFSLTTAAAVVGASAGDVLVGTLASYSYLVMAAAAFTCLYLWVRAGHLRLGLPWSALLLTAFVILSGITPVLYYVVVGVTALVMVLLSRLQQKDPRNLSSTKQRRLQAPIVVLPLIANLVWVGILVSFLWPTLRVPWVAAEVIHFNTEEVVSQHIPHSAGSGEGLTPAVKDSTVVGYVLSNHDGWMSILTAGQITGEGGADGRRFVMRVPSEAVESRYICRVNEQLLKGRQIMARFWMPYDSPNTSCQLVLTRLAKGEIPNVQAGVPR